MNPIIAYPVNAQDSAAADLNSQFNALIDDLKAVIAKIEEFQFLLHLRWQGRSIESNYDEATGGTTP